MAGEVQSLARRSSTAAKEIKGLITDSVEHVERGSVRVRDAGTTMREIVQAVHQVSTLLGEISGALAEQSQGIDQVNIAVVQMDSVTQQNAALVAKAARASTELSVQANQLQKVVGEFNLEPTDAPVAQTSATKQRGAAPMFATA